MMSRHRKGADRKRGRARERANESEMGAGIQGIWKTNIMKARVKSQKRSNVIMSHIIMHVSQAILDEMTFLCIVAVLHSTEIQIQIQNTPQTPARPGTVLRRA